MSAEKRSHKDILVMDGSDNVAVCLRDIAAGEQLVLAASDGEALTARDAVPRGHKICTRKIARGEPVVKYGEVIGKASAPIDVGQHVHVHNVTD
jgi:altronate dehydratase